MTYTSRKGDRDKDTNRDGATTKNRERERTRNTEMWHDICD